MYSFEQAAVVGYDVIIILGNLNNYVLILFCWEGSCNNWIKK